MSQLHAAAATAQRENPTWRAGQAYFNVLVDLEPACAEAVRGMLVDPFYNDLILPDFRRFAAGWLEEEVDECAAQHPEEGK